MSKIIPTNAFVEGVRRDIETLHPNDPHIKETMYQMAHYMFGYDIREKLPCDQQVAA